MKGTFQQYETWYFLYYNSSLKKPQTLFSLIFAKRKIIHNENKTFIEYNFIALFLSYCLSFAFQVKVKAIYVRNFQKLFFFPILEHISVNIFAAGLIIFSCISQGRNSFLQPGLSRERR